ncbi:carbohydrate ABC transporter substrate-binding protein, CUT1 family [Pseudarthrobacter phenanthrenivorans Sphe3]|uniref:Carbohydrate ABC transporter substrate-binding protein, CUT1 family n=1 Tax=Pseudarthrobacter phenanthrenivorans (strain DSM 18606 / JCM 16027 / LMG 23796 / Sphe3) TaxID=930171 RepID=F0M565_PSEPM|nr:extracellular solute-binding protein [Pseudarthrobacter phenanthrenivorans]ADX74585.1 carbohydrate ABC transporter substrate-binding protein, CUT1 family [Pseudarthrobacter phenanthrenivorans Sphe3]
MLPPLTSQRTPVSRRTFLAVAGSALTAFGLAGCAPGGERPTVTFHQSKPEAVPYFRDLAAKYTASQDRVRVLHDMATNLSASFVRSSPPDLGCLNYNLEMARFMERGALSDLSDLPEAASIRDDVLDLTNWYPTYPGRTSVIPYSVMAASVIYNRRIFEQNGLTVPTTWDELINVCEVLNAAGITPIYGTFRDPWTIAQGLFDYTVGGMVNVRDFYRKMHEIGADVGPDSEVSFQKTLLEPVQRMVQLTTYVNADAPSRGYGDGNTAMAQGQAAMYFQGPWAFGEIEKAGTDLDLGTFPLPMTSDPGDLKVRVNVDLSLWVPEVANAQEGAREFLQYLMQPEIQNPYNAEFLGFGTTKNAPAVTDPRIAEMQKYYDEGRFYMGASQFIPNSIPAPNYFQSIIGGADAEATLRRLDADWARLAFRA